MTTSRHQRFIVVFMTLAGLGFIAGVLIFMFFPALKDVNALSQEVIDAQAELEAQYANRKNLLDSITKVSRIRSTTEDLKSQFIKPGDEIVFITRIEEVSAANGVEASIRLSGTAVRGEATVNDVFDIGLVGTYPSVLAALRDIERLPNMTTVVSAIIRSGDIAPETPSIISLNVRGRIALTPEGL